MKLTLPQLFYLGILALVLLYAASLSVTAEAGAPDGIAAIVATSSEPTVAASAQVLFSTSTCMSRVISTSASPIMLTFSDWNGSSPTALIGAVQAASTTVVYNASLYGCGLFKAYSFASGPVFLSETR